MKLKTRKALSKRIKVTKNNKMITRPAGQDHFRAKKSGRKIRHTHGDQQLSASTQKIFTNAVAFKQR